MTASTHLSQLRSACADAHTELENHLDLLDPELSIQRYVNTLTLLRQHHAVWEPLLSAHDDENFAYTYKLGWLDQDLSYFECSSSLAEVPQAPLSRAQAFGVAYVLEGASLGGRVIAPHVQSVLGLNEQGTRYFRGNGDNTASEWNAYRTKLNNFLDQDPASRADVHSAAISAFVTLLDHAKVSL